MSEDYGEHCERLAGYGVGSGELRDYEPFSLEDAETVEANELSGQTNLSGGRNTGDVRWQPESISKDHCNPYRGETQAPPAHNSLQPIVAPSSAIPEDAEESYCDWLNEVERNQRENEREVEEQAWRDQELLQEETDNT